ncbi:MAG: hypothetical protein IJE08_06430 [Clostridia bacterium]|nr:hypothetical protein [Clostridia bacterium]
MQQFNRNTDHQSAQPDPQFVNTVAAVVQVLQNKGTGDDQQKGRAVNTDHSEGKTIDLIGLMFHVIERFWCVLLAALIGAGFFGYLAGKSVPMYTATSKLYIVNANNSMISIADLQMGNFLTMDYQEVFKTWEVHEMVREELNLPYSYEQMQSLLTVSNPEDTRLLYITVRYQDAQMAADIANAYAQAAKEFILNTMRSEEPSDFSIALVPSVAIVKSKSVEMVKGFLLGSVLAVGILTLMFVLDERPRTPESISTYGGIPTLAVLPSTKDVAKASKRKNTHTHKRNGRRA